ncbi:MAG: sialate O-acetylesterase, partial [Mariniblastus sp.]
GLLNATWGGTRVEPWTPPSGFKNVPAVNEIYQSVVGRTPGSPVYKTQLNKHITATEQWLAKAKQAVDTLEPLAAPLAYPSSLTPYTKHQDPTMLYNGMIHALVGFPIRGAIWYQGESNHRDGMLYFEKKKALIQGWRELWGQGDFPFYFVQIAPHNYGSEDPAILAEFWEAQTAVTTLPNTGMVVTNDIAPNGNLHPPNKQDVGLRLANLALKNDYGQTELVASGPEFASLEAIGSSLKIKLKNCGGQLKTRDDQPPSHFEIIGPDAGGFQPATATIGGDSIVLVSDAVKTPTAFRFAWNKIAQPNLCGGTGLPVSAFRGGKIPDFSENLPLGDNYKLVYELDLAGLGKSIKYEVDNSSQIGSFDRIGYLVSLKSSEFGDQDVFVSMKAFTDDVKKIGIPTVDSEAHFQQVVEEVEVFSNAKNITAGKIPKGNIEFWPNNYSPANGKNFPEARANRFDFDDTPDDRANGHGSMQIHNIGAKQTLFSITGWRAGSRAGVGIGNCKGPNPDWTFSRNAGKYSSKKLQVYVRTH